MLRNVRIQRELAMLNSELPPGIVCNPVADMLDTFEAVITGANGTPYEGGIFKLNIRIPERYPFEAPVAVFQTPVYHPNVDSTGRICLDVLQMPPKGRWRPSLNLKVVLLSLHALLAQPNPDDPLVPELADQFKYQRDMFNRLAAEHTRRHAMGWAFDTLFLLMPCLLGSKRLSQLQLFWELEQREVFLVQNFMLLYLFSISKPPGLLQFPIACSCFYCESMNIQEAVFTIECYVRSFYRGTMF